MTIYTGSIERARASIAKKGDLCTWRQWDVDAGTTDWTEDEASTFTDYACKIVFFPFNGFNKMTFQQVAGDVERYSSYGLMVPAGFTPKLRDLVIRSDGTTMKPMGLDELKPGAEVVLYTLGFVG